MEQTTHYLYEYQDGKRVRNIGLIKMEQQMGKCFIQIYAKDIDAVRGIVFQKDDGVRYLTGWEDEREVDSYISPKHIRYEKIQRQDLSRLPRKEWRIANNSFLLHGYRNYHHLLYIEEGEKVWVGVPGIFHEKEEEAANAFGFTDFFRLTDTDIKLEENEKNTYEDFGYWCRQIPSSQV